MRSYAEVMDSAVDRVAFSNGTSWEIWSFRWCENCVNDVNEDCPLVAVAMFGRKTPSEWQEVGLQSYECSEFEPREDSPYV